MPIDETASVVALAQTLLQGIDPSAPATLVSTPSLQLVLVTFITEFRQGNRTAQQVQAAQMGFINSRRLGYER